MSSPVISPETKTGKKILLAAPRGYCAGVDRAVETVERALEEYGAPVYVRKEIVHNRYVVDTLAEKGAIFVNEASEAPEGANMVFSAHGVSPMVHEEAAAKNIKAIDAACPLVTKVHKEVQRFDKQGFHILFIGHEGHEEVEGTMGHSLEKTHLVDGVAGIATLPEFLNDEPNLIWLSQTTLSVDETMEIVRELKVKFPQLQDPPSDDICYATQNRQVAVKAIAERCELMIVVGSRNSSNSVRLVEVAKQNGADNAYLVDYAREIDPAWFEGVETIGISSGASVPEILVQGVIERLAEFGFDDVEEVTSAAEKIVFALPRVLRHKN